MARDNFSAKTKRILADRVNHVCSNPTCKCNTSGPGTKSDQSVKIGVACHITAAALGGARYNNNLSVTERSHIENGIHLCQNCAAYIDKDPEKHTVDLLNKWKKAAEDDTLKGLKGDSLKSKNPIDVDLFYRRVPSQNENEHHYQFIICLKNKSSCIVNNPGIVELRMLKVIIFNSHKIKLVGEEGKQTVIFRRNLSDKPLYPGEQEELIIECTMTPDQSARLNLMPVLFKYYNEKGELIDEKDGKLSDFHEF